MDKCIYCGSSNIEKELSVGTGEGKTGIKYLEFIIPKVEYFFTDLCKDCGSVRIYVKNTDRDWS